MCPERRKVELLVSSTQDSTPTSYQKISAMQKKYSENIQSGVFLTSVAIIYLKLLPSVQPHMISLHTCNSYFSNSHLM